MTSISATCFHCGEPIPIRVGIVARVAGGERPVCCHGCRAVAEFIDGAGLTDYYLYRDGTGMRADTAPRSDRWTSYDSPALLERLTSQASDGSRSLVVLLEGVRCAACGWLADHALRRLPGVIDVGVNAATARARLVWDPAAVQLSVLLRTLENVGLPPHPAAGEPAGKLAMLERRSALKRLAVAGFGMMQVMMFAVPLYSGDAGGMTADMREFLRLVSMIVSVPVAVYAGWPFYTAAWHALRARRITMDVPVSLGVLLAFAASVWNTQTGTGEVYFDSVTMFVFFLSLARYVEMVVRHRAGSTADALARLAPVNARRVRDGVVEDIATLDIEIGDELMVRTGEVLAADGIIATGDGRLDESMLTGESTHVLKSSGSQVHAGTRNVGSPLRIRVTAVAAGTMLAGIVGLLERAQTDRPRLARSADAIAAWFLSRILVAASIVFAAWWFIDPTRAFAATLAVLVVTCPCALALATPAALASAASALARQGILVTRTDAIESLAKATHILWDKTGTLTLGRLTVDRVQPFADHPESLCLEIAAALESMSEHPIARAFISTCSTSLLADDCVVTAGAGIEGRVAGVRYRIGTLAFVLEHGRAAPTTVARGADDKFDVFLGSDSVVLAGFKLADTVRADAHDCVAQLGALGLESRMLSGDRPDTVARIAKRLGISRFESRTSPAGKLAALDRLHESGRVVIAVGDGINDAALLRGADVSIAMGRGSALAQSNADLILVRESLAQLPAAIALARRTRRIVRQNLAWSLVYNAVALPVAALGLVPPWVAAIGMSLSSILVVGNAARVSWPSRRDERPHALPNGIPGGAPA